MSHRSPLRRHARVTQLDPDAQALLDAVAAAATVPPYALPIDQARNAARAALIAKCALPDLYGVEEMLITAPGRLLRLRLYRPAEGSLPIALFLHGGGWTLNDLDTHDRLCRLIARRSGWLLASLEYRHAPENKYPAALEDAYFGYRWLVDNTESIDGDARYRAIIGESSGGTIAACLVLLLRDLGAPLPSYQILAYPATDTYDRWPSYKERGCGYLLDRKLLRWFFGNYLPEVYDHRDPYLFPLAAPDLTGLPATLVLTAEFDPLRDEGYAYVKRLANAGVKVEHVHAEDQMHGFLLLDRAIRRTGELIECLADKLAAHARTATVLECGPTCQRESRWGDAVIRAGS
jgi:acetyl esterase/lipase